MTHPIRPILLIILLSLAGGPVALAQRPFYSGATLSDPNFHDGGLSPVIGVHNIQIMRANRDAVDESDGFGWTYNHAPMLARWKGKYYCEYLSDPRSEHVMPSHTLITTSTDGYAWSFPQVVFPSYKVPDGTVKDGSKPSVDQYAVMHQRMGFIVGGSNRLFALGYYGIALPPKGSPVDGRGIGRVIREILEDGSFGPIYFIHYNSGYDEKNTDYPFFKHSRDKGFVKACEEILANPLITDQWAEESDRGDAIITTPAVYQAMSWYHLPDSSVVALFKHAQTMVSTDEGKTWDGSAARAKGFVNSNAKIWGQRLSDGSFATVYNPSEFRWPLAISLSRDGVEYTTLNLVHGEVPIIRYGGDYKSYGPQYVRGIIESNPQPEDGNLHLVYSVGKEDIWTSHIPVPVRVEATGYPDDDFSSYSDISEMRDWNVYSPRWAPVSLTDKDGQRWLTMSDRDPFDYAKVERLIPATQDLTLEMTLLPEQSDHGDFELEFKDERGLSCTRIEFTPDGTVRLKRGYRYGNIGTYKAGEPVKIVIKVSTAARKASFQIGDSKPEETMFYSPATSVTRIVMRTGATRYFPSIETPTDPQIDQKNASAEDPLAVWKITGFKAEASADRVPTAVLKPEDFSHWVDRFNTMEDESVVKAIPNAQSWQWMEDNIPFFECPDQDFEEIYYFRWWAWRKHITKTPAGYALSEFIIHRSHADEYDMISCATGHHILEGRWLRDPSWIEDYVNVWFRGNDGKPMEKYNKFSSWTSYALMEKYKVDLRQDFLLAQYEPLKIKYKEWEDNNLLPNGFFWQYDVKDGMEESISGGRKVKNARPTINSYMYGNSVALSRLAEMAGDQSAADNYRLKAENIRSNVLKLWNPEDEFFETMAADTMSRSREAIGYIPWYFDIPEGDKYDAAWQQIRDPQGFSAPYGLTTAERRHPLFRSHGTGTCEWDGAIWPFASSQTLTALANLLNDYDQDVVGKQDYFKQLLLLAESQHKRGKPYIGEYLDEVDGAWVFGDAERSRYYNHSTFADLVINGLVGLRPDEGQSLTVNPLLPEGTWDWFCLDAIPYHGHFLTVIWDRDGHRYRQGKGLTVLADGIVKATRKDLGSLTINL